MGEQVEHEHEHEIEWDWAGEKGYRSGNVSVHVRTVRAGGEGSADALNSFNLLF